MPVIAGFRDELCGAESLFAVLDALFCYFNSAPAHSQEMLDSFFAVLDMIVKIWSDRDSWDTKKVLMLDQMLLAPHWDQTKKFMKSFGIFIPLSIIYAYLLGMSWQQDTLQLMMPGNMQDGMKGD